jgi:FkbM family methyltransferase
MMKWLKDRVPDGLRPTATVIYRRIRPPIITLTDFVESGCKFEITSRKERYRVRSLGDEADFARLFFSEIRSGDVVFDIGSSVGLYALHAGLLNANVIAFEPDPAYRKRLKRNIKLNKLRRTVRVVEWVVSDQQGHAILYSDGIDGNSPSLTQAPDRQTLLVKTDSIDHALIKNELPRPDLIKIDIEGAEALALPGMTDMLTATQAPRLLFVEFHPELIEKLDSSLNRCQGILSDCGYRLELEMKRNDQVHAIYRKVGTALQ